VISLSPAGRRLQRSQCDGRRFGHQHIVQVHIDPGLIQVVDACTTHRQNSPQIRRWQKKNAVLTSGEWAIAFSPCGTLRGFFRLPAIVMNL
jgi:hypothetical protein